nr:hypothetical protein PJ912_06385 [Pectobacterium colocasium]
MAAADAAAMMWRRQTGTSQRGGSVSGGKSARRGVRVAGRLTWPKTLPEKAVAFNGLSALKSTTASGSSL